MKRRICFRINECVTTYDNIDMLFSLFLLVLIDKTAHTINTNEQKVVWVFKTEKNVFCEDSTFFFAPKKCSTLIKALVRFHQAV